MTVDVASHIKKLSTIASIAVAISAIGAATVFILSNIKPKIKVDSVDYANGVASLIINGKSKNLYANSTLNCGNGWGVRFGFMVNQNGQQVNNRIELTKNNIVYETLNVR